jgi:hypothetical protein
MGAILSMLKQYGLMIVSLVRSTLFSLLALLQSFSMAFQGKLSTADEGRDKASHYHPFFMSLLLIFFKLSSTKLVESISSTTPSHRLTESSQ